MKRFYYAKLDGYVSVVSDDPSMTDWYVKNNVASAKSDGEMRDRDGNKMRWGSVEASDYRDAYPLVDAALRGEAI